MCCAGKFQIIHGEAVLSGVESNGQLSKYGLRTLTSLQKVQQGRGKSNDTVENQPTLP